MAKGYVGRRELLTSFRPAFGDTCRADLTLNWRWFGYPLVQHLYAAGVDGSTAHEDSDVLSVVQWWDEVETASLNDSCRGHCLP